MLCALLGPATMLGMRPGRLPLRPRACARMVATSQGELWDEREIWALEDAVPRYAVDAGRLVLWDRLALDVPELVTRSGEELRTCWFDPPTALQKGKLENALAECPPRLEDWERLEDGSVRGVLYGVAGVRDGGIRATVSAVPAEVGCSMAEAEQWCVRTRDGDVYQLGLPAAEIESTSAELALAPLEIPDSVGEAAAAAAPGAKRALVAVAAPAAVLALLVCGVLVATGGHLHIPHVDVSVFIV